ncbi:ImmA/IrrE family metallo-endopeptidase [Frisingicoccus sp.]|uniref:ImmA/IrrE family metallo-endopeptidase n=1 Tax=Frisingicoccus sp. TaxID=1918627 RepID=UPI00399B0772
MQFQLPAKKAGSSLYTEIEQKVSATDIFAGELLIPEPLLKEIYSKFYLPSLKTLAKIFHVSTNVMAARLDDLSMPYFKDAELTFY